MFTLTLWTIPKFKFKGSVQYWSNMKLYLPFNVSGQSDSRKNKISQHTVEASTYLFNIDHQCWWRVIHPTLMVFNVENLKSTPHALINPSSTVITSYQLISIFRVFWSTHFTVFLMKTTTSVGAKRNSKFVVKSLSSPFPSHKTYICIVNIYRQYMQMVATI